MQLQITTWISLKDEKVCKPPLFSLLSFPQDPKHTLPFLLWWHIPAGESLSCYSSGSSPTSPQLWAAAGAWVMAGWGAKAHAAQLPGCCTDHVYLREICRANTMWSAPWNLPVKCRSLPEQGNAEASPVWTHTLWPVSGTASTNAWERASKQGVFSGVPPQFSPPQPPATSFFGSCIPGVAFANRAACGGAVEMHSMIFCNLCMSLFIFFGGYNILYQKVPWFDYRLCQM